MQFKKWNKWAILLFICAAIMLCIGFYKMNVYETNEYSSRNSKNAYVGGDAYNYIINANYATGFFVLGGFSALGAIAVLIGQTIANDIVRMGNAYDTDAQRERRKESPPLTQARHDENVVDPVSEFLKK